MRKTTRQHDLDLLDDSRSKAKTPEGKRHRQALLEAVYAMSKDATLEKARIKLIDALKRGDLRQIEEIRKQVQAYASSTTFKRHIAHKIAKVSGEKEAEIWYNKH